MSEIQNSKCISCGTPFHCGAKENSPCWCFSLPAAMPLPENPEKAGCFCPKCLNDLIQKSEKVLKADNKKVKD